SRRRPTRRTGCAMIAGMVPLALALGEGGEQTAPLGRAVIGGLGAATLATLVVLPSVFAIVQGRSSTLSVSLDPDDAESRYYEHKVNNAASAPKDTVHAERHAHSPPDGTSVNAVADAKSTHPR